MIDHISVAVRDLQAAARFYEALLATLGMSKLREWPDESIGFGKKYPEFWINKRADMAPVVRDSGTHVCLRARIITIIITPPSSAIPTATASKR